MSVILQNRFGTKGANVCPLYKIPHKLKQKDI